MEGLTLRYFGIAMRYLRDAIKNGSKNDNEGASE